jgi:hypothetical protein
MTVLGAFAPAPAQRVAVTSHDQRRDIGLTSEGISVCLTVSPSTLTASPGRPARTSSPTTATDTDSSAASADDPLDPPEWGTGAAEVQTAQLQIEGVPSWRARQSAARTARTVRRSGRPRSRPRSATPADLFFTDKSPASVRSHLGGAVRTCTLTRKETGPNAEHHHGTAHHPRSRPRRAARPDPRGPGRARAHRRDVQGRDGRASARPGRRASGSCRHAGVTAMTVIINEPAVPVVARVTMRGTVCPLHPWQLLNLGSRFHYCADDGGHRVRAAHAAVDVLFGGAA